MPIKEGLQVRGKKGLSVVMIMYILIRIRVLQVYAIVKNNLYTKEMCISWNIYYFSIKILKVKIKSMSAYKWSTIYFYFLSIWYHFYHPK